jgi:hypothetical protein
VDAGERDAAVLEGLVVAALAAADLEADYVELVDRSTMAHLPRLDRDAFLAVAARVGLPTLIDNVHFDVAADGDVAVDRGRTLPGPSVLSAGDEPDSPDPD